MKKNFSWFERFLILNVALILIFFPYIGYLPWWPVNVYIPIMLFFYAFIKKHMFIWIGVYYIISSILCYYSMKFMPENENIFFILTILSTFGLAFVFTFIYLYSIKEIRILKVIGYTLILGWVCLVPCYLTAFICFYMTGNF